jgi:hypothetical protein
MFVRKEPLELLISETVAEWLMANLLQCFTKDVIDLDEMEL